MDTKRSLIYAAVISNILCIGGLVIHFTPKAQPQRPQTFVQPYTPAPIVPVAPKALDIPAMQALITEASCREIVTWLADPLREGRMSGKKGNRETAQYVKAKFESYGLQTSLHQFKVRRMNPGPKNETGDDFSNNVIGVLPGESERRIVIGGHMDHVGYGPQMSLDGITGIHPGADDNGSGATTVMELARVLSKGPKPKHTLVFMCFSGEEMGLLGSRAYVTSLGKEVDKIDLMVNYDMVGYLRGDSLPALGARAVPELIDIIGKIGNKYPFKVFPAPDSSGNSDHASFGQAGVPYVFFFTGLHANYHRVSDTADKINYTGMTGIARFGVEMIMEYDKTSVAPRNYIFARELKAMCIAPEGN